MTVERLVLPPRVKEVIVLLSGGIPLAIAFGLFLHIPTTKLGLIAGFAVGMVVITLGFMAAGIGMILANQAVGTKSGGSE